MPRRFKTWTLFTHATFALVVLTISKLWFPPKPGPTCEKFPADVREPPVRFADSPPRQLAPEVTPRTRKEPIDIAHLYDEVKSFVLFIGHARTGHSIVGSLLDAHPEVLISHEMGLNWDAWTPKRRNDLQKRLLKYRLLNDIHANSLRKAMIGRRAPVSGIWEGEHTYTYHVRGQWQGQFRDKITVMGDKSGHFTSRHFTNPKNLVQLNYLKDGLGVPLRIIHVLRNPFDVIATQTLRYDSPQGRDTSSSDNKMNNTALVDVLIRKYFQRAEANRRVREEHDVFEILGDELAQQPRESMHKLCDYVGIQCEEDYIDACATMLNRKPSITRELIVWTKAQKKLVQANINKYSFLRRYSFKSNP